MNASEYLTYKKKQCSKTIARNQCMDAGVRTEMLQRAANTYSGANNALLCQTKTTGFKSTDTLTGRPIACCASTDRYSSPFITIPGEPMPHTSTLYLSPCKVQPYQGTRFDTFKGACCD